MFSDVSTLSQIFAHNSQQAIVTPQGTICRSIIFTWLLQQVGR